MKGKAGSKIRSIFFSHWLLKIMSLLLAFVLWFVVISTNDPVDEKRFQNIKVNLLNTELLTDNGQVYEVLDNTDVLRTVTFDAPVSVRREIQSSDIIAEADLSNLTVTNTVEIRFSCPKYGDQVQNISGNIEFVKLNIEKKTRKTVSIEVVTVGSVAEGYIEGPSSLDRNRVEIQGPESVINQIVRAEVEVDVNGITRNSNASGNIRLLDAGGNEIVKDSVSKNIDTVTATVEVWNIKEIPVVYEYSGTLAENCQAADTVEATVNTVRVTGPTAVLSGVTQLAVDPEDINITGSVKDFETVVHLKDYLPKGIYFAEENFDDTSQVRVAIEEIIEKTISLQVDNIQIINVPEGVNCEVVGNISSAPLVARGLTGYMALLQPSTLQGVVDVGAWIESSNPPQPLEGDFSLPINVSLLPEQEKVRTPAITLRFTLIRDEEENTGEEE